MAGGGRKMKISLMLAAMAIGTACAAPQTTIGYDYVDSGAMGSDSTVSQSKSNINQTVHSVQFQCSWSPILVIHLN